MATATKERTGVTFISRSRNLRVILKPRREMHLQNAAGQVVASPPLPVEELPPQQFVRDIVSEEDFAKLPSAVDFKNWTYETDDPAVIAVLRAHPNLGRKNAGFSERYPSAEERLSEVTRLIAAGDAAGLRALLEVERAQGAHASVLDAGEAALAALDTNAEPEGEAAGETAEAGSTDDSDKEPRDGPPDS
jgi:hypothetical protein